MSNDKCVEVSMSAWFDSEVGGWMYSIFSAHNDDETLIAWGEESSRAEAVSAAVRELQTFLSGV